MECWGKLKQWAVKCLRKHRIGAEPRLTLKFFLRYTRQFHYRPLQASFEILIPVNGDSDSQVAPLTDIDVVATGYTSQTPSFSIKNLAHAFAAYGLHVRWQSP